MKNFLLLFVVLVTQVCFSQNQGVIIAPNYTKDISLGIFHPLPASSDPNNIDPIELSDGYDGQEAESSSNIILTPTGEILFFVIDGVIFDENGDAKDVLYGYTAYDEYDTYGSAEIVIVPDPGNCKQFYIFSNDSEDNNVPGSFNGSNATCDLYNVELGQVVLRKSWFGSFISNVAFFNFTGASLGLITTNRGYGSLTATKMQSDGSYYVIFKLGKSISSVKIDQNGIAPNVYFDNQLPIGIQNQKGAPRPIMEIYQKSNNEFITAFSNLGVGSSDASLILFTFNSDFSQIINHSKTDFQSEPNAENVIFTPFIHGLEFSPNGEYLYITHNTNSLHPNQFEYIDIVAPTVVYPLSIGNNYNLRFSEIEIKNIAGTKSLLIAHENGILRLDNPNNPMIATIQNHTTIPINANYSSYHQNKRTDGSKYFLLSDQIDNLDYATTLVSDPVCCKDYNSYSIDFYTATVSETWDGNNNPFNTNGGNVVTIKNELRIPAGISITINDMIFEFAPEAKVIIENGTNGLINLNGGVLSLVNNTVFTVDERCATDEMWLGVEVWGDNSLSQTPVQGKLKLKKSTIEHAWIGALIGKRISSTTFDNNRNGGIIQASYSTFFNNQRGVYFRPYIAPLGSNNVSSFTKSHFIWDGYLKGNEPLLQQAFLEEVKGIPFRGCDFSNNSPSLYTYNELGIGILSRNAQFYVSPKCNTIQQVGQPCNNETRSSFANLRAGIFTTNSNSLTFECIKSDFINNQYGIVALGTDQEKVTQNHFEIKEDDNIQSVGLFMWYSTGYVVQENDFDEFNNPNSSSPNSYGIVVNNSGQFENLIYKNNFSNLMIGGQTEGLNAQLNEHEVGLVWKCNTFRINIEKHDLTLMKNGNIRYHQGDALNTNQNTTYIQAKRGAANNVFSLVGEPVILAHDLYVDPSSYGYTYHHLDISTHIPDSKSAIVNADFTEFNNVNISENSNTCPSLLSSGKTKIQLIAKVDNLANRIENNEDKIKRGDRPQLYNIIANGNNGQKKNKLLDASPFLSDSVLVTYIETQPPFGHLKQVMIANSPLKNLVLQALLDANLPNGVLNQIQNAQNGVSGREVKINHINYLTGKRELFFNELTQLFLLDSTQSAGASMPWLISILEEENTVKSKTLLFKIYITAKDSVNANLVKQDLANLGATAKFLKLAELELQIIKASSTCKAVHSDPVLENKLNTIRYNIDDKQVGSDAGCILDIHAAVYIPPVFVESSAIMLQNSGQQDTEEEKINLSSETTFTMYPNPTTGVVTFDFSSHEDGELKIELVDLAGKVVYTHVSTFTNVERLDLSEVHNGMYVVKISIDGNEVAVEQLVIRK